MATRSFTAHWLGRVRYAEAHALQERLVDGAHRAARSATRCSLLEHEPVVTLGRGAHAENVLVAARGARAPRRRLLETGRGGDVTYHGPGQLVAYPIFDLQPGPLDVRRYVRDLARVMIAPRRRPRRRRRASSRATRSSWASGSTGRARRAGPAIRGEDGGAARPAKLGAIGVQLSRWVTMHGFAFNVTTDLTAFGLIVPCGITRYGVTSLEDLGKLGTPAATVESVARESVACFERVFDAEGRMAGAGERPLL